MLCSMLQNKEGKNNEPYNKPIVRDYILFINFIIKHCIFVAINGYLALRKNHLQHAGN